ncbi:hypothetical protein V8F33_008609 [Rhypophila sp. PSN 637]
MIFHPRLPYHRTWVLFVRVGLNLIAAVCCVDIQHVSIGKELSILKIHTYRYHTYQNTGKKEQQEMRTWKWYWAIDNHPSPIMYCLVLFPDKLATLVCLSTKTILKVFPFIKEPYLLLTVSQFRRAIQAGVWCCTWLGLVKTVFS